MTIRPVPLAVLILALAAPAAADDPSPGAVELQKCKICHMLDDSGGSHVGPNLHGVFGRKAGTAPDYNFSDAMKTSGIVWDDGTMTKFLRDPKAVLPGSKMSFPGIKDAAVLSDLLLQLKQATQ
jgi:cytochrome c